MVRKDPVKTLVTPNYVKKTITIRPNKDNQIFTFKQVKEYSEKQLKKLPKNAKVIFTGLNILRNSTLKGYDDDFMNEDEYDTYARGKVKDTSKFDKFYNFTITVRLPNNESMFKHKN